MIYCLCASLLFMVLIMIGTECLLSNSKKTDQYNQICSESFGFKKEREEKITSKIAKSVFIDKK